MTSRSEKLKGHPVSLETRKKISESVKLTMTNEHRLRLSLTNKGKHLSEETKYKIGLASTGRTKSPEVRLKMSLARKNIPSNRPDYHHSEETKKKISKGNKGKICSEETKKYLATFTKEKASNWKGGLSNQPYPFEFNHKLKESIRNRDNFQCQLCYTNQNKYRLHIHHIDYNKMNLKENNLVSLCNKCHTTTNYNRNYYTEYFNTLLRNKYASL